MSIWGTIRKKKIWVAVGATLGTLLLLWAIGALLIQKGILPVNAQPGWLLGASLLAGLAGGCIGRVPKAGVLISSFVLTVGVVAVELLFSWLFYGGISFAEGRWKSIVFLFAGSFLAELICHGGRKGKRRFNPGRGKVSLHRKR